MKLEATDGKKTGRVRAFPIFLGFVFFVSVFFYFNFHTVEVRGRSMMPTLKEGRRVLVTNAYWLVGKLRRGDIVVIKEFTNDGYFIKRVHAIEGDQVETAFAPRSHRIVDGKFSVPAGMIHVIGDNLPESEDSRKFGPVKVEQVLGKVLIWP